MASRILITESLVNTIPSPTSIGLLPLSRYDSATGSTATTPSTADAVRSLYIFANNAAAVGKSGVTLTSAGYRAITGVYRASC